MVLAVVSTLISSIALAGVAVSLLLQARQLRANQIQIVRTSHLELMKLGLTNPRVISELGMGVPGAENFVKSIFLNWYLTHLLTTYDTGLLSKSNLEFRMAELFAAADSRKWWEAARKSYYDDINSRRQKDFYLIVDRGFQLASSTVEPPESDA